MELIPAWGNHESCVLLEAIKLTSVLYAPLDPREIMKNITNLEMVQLFAGTCILEI